VLEYGFAFGSHGTELKGKALMSVLSTGGESSGYSRRGLHGHSLREFLLPFEKTAHLCNMAYLPPFVVSGTHKLDSAEILQSAQDYREILEIVGAGAMDRDTIIRVRLFQ